MSTPRTVLILLTVAVVAAAASAVYMLTRPSLSVREEFSDLILVAEIPKVDFRGGETVAVSVALKTTTKSSLNLGFLSSQRFNVLVYNEGGRLVYNWSAHQTFKHEFEVYQVLMVPDKEVTETIVWNLRDDSGKPVPSGRYYLLAETPLFIYGYVPGLVQGSGTTHIVRANPDLAIFTGKLYFTINQ